MLAVDPNHRKRGIGSALVVHAVGSMREHGCTQAYLETEHTNKAALRLYLNLGFVKDKLLARYYLNGNDAFRLKLLLAPLCVDSSSTTCSPTPTSTFTPETSSSPASSDTSHVSADTTVSTAPATSSGAATSLPLPNNKKNRRKKNRKRRR
jgi:predicted GNAT family acetyltransferase